MHPVEHIIYFGTCLIHLVIPSDPLHVVWHLMFNGLAPAAGHSGYNEISNKKDGDNSSSSCIILSTICIINILNVITTSSSHLINGLEPFMTVRKSLVKKYLHTQVKRIIILIPTF